MDLKTAWPFVGLPLHLEVWLWPCCEVDLNGEGFPRVGAVCRGTIPLQRRMEATMPRRTWIELFSRMLACDAPIAVHTAHAASILWHMGHSQSGQHKGLAQLRGMRQLAHPQLAAAEHNC